MIPKILHLCWLSGDAYPELIQTCVDSWKRVLPDYQIMLWDRSRIDINSIPWVKEAFESRKYAFAADYVRFYALYNYGGIYLDADVEVLRSFDSLLDRREFVGEESSGDIEAAVVGAEPNLAWVKECLDYYEGRHFIKPDGSLDMRPVPLLVTSVLSRYPDVRILPFYYFSPKDYNVGKICINDETYCVHHFDGKWVKQGLVYKTKILIHKAIYAVYGREGHNQIIHRFRKLKSKI